MPWNVPIALCLAGALAASAAISHASTAGSRATLRLTSVQPVIVKGVAFHRHERVQLVLRTKSMDWKHNLSASIQGTFTTTFDVALGGRCNGFTITAKGQAGSRAVLHHPPLPACSPA